MKKYVFTLMCAAAVLLAACDQPAGEETGSGITVTGGTTLAVAADQTTTTLAFSAEAAWTAAIESGAEWLLEVTPASGEAGDQTLTLNFTANETEAVRTATVRLASGEDAVTVTVTQQGKKDEGGEQPAGDAIIKRMEIYGEWAVLTTDAQGRITKIESVMEDGSLVPDTELAYTDDRLTIAYFDGDDTSTSLYEMANGRVVRGLEYEGKSNLDTFTYNADGTLAEYKMYGQEIMTNPDGDITVTDLFTTMTYTWTDGNVTRIRVEGDEEYPVVFTITYGTQTSGIKNLDLIDVFVESGNLFTSLCLTGVPSRNLPVKIVETHEGEDYQDEIALRYEFAENGAVAKVFAVSAFGEALLCAMEY